MKDTNPFLLTGYRSPVLFCDREHETSLLISNAVNGANTTLLSLRRMGKTGLLRHALLQLQKKHGVTGIYLDIFDTQDLPGLVNRLATAVYRAVPEKHPLWTKVVGFLRQMRAVISYDEISGQPQVSLDFARPVQYQQSLQNILAFLESQKKTIVVAIDEFQQITRYPETNTEALLRTHIQPLQHTRFIFSGSSPHLLAEMFNSVKRPFFASTRTLELKEIDATAYSRFIMRLFARGQRKISTAAVNEVLAFTKRHTFYTQALCNKLYANGYTNIQADEVRASEAQLLTENEPTYFQYRSLLTANQWELLRAIAVENRLYRPTAGTMMRKYALGAASAVQRGIEALITKEMVYEGRDGQGKYYSVYDCFLSRWLENKPA